MIRSGPLPDASSYAAVILDAKDLERIFGKNRFARLGHRVGQMGTPAGNAASDKASAVRLQRGGRGDDRICNERDLCELYVRTVLSGSEVGAGKYATMLGLSATEKRRKSIGWFSYVVTVDASFCPYRLGDVNMDAMRGWANAIADELSFSFSEESIWNQTKENFLFRSDVPQSPPRFAPGPLRFAQPPQQGQSPTPHE